MPDIRQPPTCSTFNLGNTQVSAFTPCGEIASTLHGFGWLLGLRSKQTDCPICCKLTAQAHAAGPSPNMTESKWRIMRLNAFGARWQQSLTLDKCFAARCNYSLDEAEFRPFLDHGRPID